MAEEPTKDMPEQTATQAPESTPPARPGSPLPQETTIAVALEAWEQAGTQHWVPIEGQSMRPLLRAGDSVLVAHRRDGIRPGDVVVFRHKGRLVAHRVLRIADGNGGRVLITKGDSVRRSDAPVPAQEIVGRVVAIQRDGRRIRLDTVGWRAVGWLVAMTTMAVATPYRWVRAIKRRPGHDPGNYEGP